MSHDFPDHHPTRRDAQPGADLVAPPRSSPASSPLSSPLLSPSSSSFPPSSHPPLAPPARGALPISVNARDDTILRAIATYFFLTVEQIVRLFYRHGSLPYVRVRLKRLADAGFLARLRLPSPGPGNTPWVYTLGRRGIAYLADAGEEDVAGRFRASETQERSYLFLSHTLAVNDVLIAATLLERAMPGVRLAQMRHERALRHEPVRVTTPEDEHLAVVPDGWLDFHIRQVARACVVLELDRGTVEQKACKRKLRALLAYASGPYQEAFGTESITVAIATTAGEERARHLLSWCEQVLRERHVEREADLFLVTALPSREAPDPTWLFLSPVWWQPFADAPSPLLDTAARA